MDHKEILISGVKLMLTAVFTALLAVRFIDDEFVISSMSLSNAIAIILLIVIGTLTIILVEIALRKAFEIVER